MPAKFIVLASGSDGNAAVVSSGKTSILVDCGLSVTALKKRLAEVGMTINDLTAVICSHEHGDHFGGVPRLVKETIKRGKAIDTYLTRITASVVNWGDLEAPPVKHFNAGEQFSIGDIGITSFSTAHDAVDPIAALFTVCGVKIGLATDLGFIPDSLRIRFRSADVVMIESNHDAEMLQASSYPDTVKERVSGRYGHLSNADTADYLRKDLGPNTKTVVLGHVSTATNTRELVDGSAIEAIRHRGGNRRVHIASQFSPSVIL